MVLEREPRTGAGGAVRSFRPECLHPVLRILLLGDGTTTRTLGAWINGPVIVDVVSETRSEVPSSLATALSVRGGSAAVRRQVRLVDGTDRSLLVLAESWILSDRLPERFLGILQTGVYGLGEALAKAELETRRVLHWIGRATAPEWSGRSDENLPARQYVVMTNEQPVMLIEECFVVQAQGADPYVDR